MNINIKKLDQLDIDKSVFTIARKTPGHYFTQQSENEQESEGKEKAKAKSFKWECPSCEAVLRTTKLEMNIICGDCNTNFMAQD